MFYSHTFLAKKGPLGTVWCAAHLQHRLKKSQYTATDICSTIDEITFPEVPIALRLSGHLLLGVVRIYSKKVDYFCIMTVKVDILKERCFCHLNLTYLKMLHTHAPIISITLADKYALEDMDVDDRTYYDRIQDDHLKDRDEITLPGSISHLIGDQNELTQELASQGLSVVYEIGDPSMKEQLVNSLVGTLTGSGKIKRIVKPNTSPRYYSWGRH